MCPDHPQGLVSTLLACTMAPVSREPLGAAALLAQEHAASIMQSGHGEDGDDGSGAAGAPYVAYLPAWLALLRAEEVPQVRV